MERLVEGLTFVVTKDRRRAGRWSRIRLRTLLLICGDGRNFLRFVVKLGLCFRFQFHRGR